MTLSHPTGFSNLNWTPIDAKSAYRSSFICLLILSGESPRNMPDNNIKWKIQRFTKCRCKLEHSKNLSNDEFSRVQAMDNFYCFSQSMSNSFTDCDRLATKKYELVWLVWCMTFWLLLRVRLYNLWRICAYVDRFWSSIDRKYLEAIAFRAL